MFTSEDLSTHARIPREPSGVAKERDPDAIPLATFLRFMDLPKDIRFLIYEHLLNRRIKPLSFPDKGVAYEVVTIDPAVAQASRQLRDEARVATRHQRLGGPLVIYMIKSFEHVGDVSRTLSMAYDSDQQHISRQRIDAAAFEHADVSDSVSESPIRLLHNIFFYAITGKYFFGRPPSERKRAILLTRSYFEFVVRKLRHNAHVEYRFLIRANNLTRMNSGKDRAEPMNTAISRQGNTRCDFVLVPDSHATQASLSQIELSPAGDCVPTELATPKELAYMRTMISQLGRARPTQSGLR
ncbi:hypothetical protein J4E90_002627 [Alternaria incomplexa]|uniref:uncharacterized protein n=1 Tax=Alternaria incomplexa TaxID=1187928 RepID=UPI002220FAA1|nr:uncharacterized protein J4E90_002627 [Alternaria incomplexa]KAI4918244.1 hypothetical protein J4E90_002627 [Alternaria incomplexa]